MLQLFLLSAPWDSVVHDAVLQFNKPKIYSFRRSGAISRECLKAPLWKFSFLTNTKVRKKFVRLFDSSYAFAFHVALHFRAFLLNT